MKLEPGYYKIQKRDYSEAYGNKNSRKNPNQVSLLKVVGIGEKQMLYFDQDTLGRPTKDFEDLKDYEVISKYEREPQVSNAHFIISFADASGERFNWKVHDAWGLRNVFEANPYLKEAFNFKRKKK